MAITILAPAPAPVAYTPHTATHDDDSDFDLDGDVDMEDSGRPTKRARINTVIVTPGEVVTDDPQWMRYATSSSSIQPATCPSPQTS